MTKSDWYLSRILLQESLFLPAARKEAGLCVVTITVISDIEEASERTGYESPGESMIM